MARKYSAWKEYWDIKGEVAKRRYLEECRRRGRRPWSTIEFEHFKAACERRGIDWVAELDLTLNYDEAIRELERKYPLPEEEPEELRDEYGETEREMEEAWEEWLESEETIKYYSEEADPEARKEWLDEVVKKHEKELEEAYREAERYKELAEKYRKELEELKRLGEEKKKVEEERKRLEEEKRRIEEEKRRVAPEELERLRLALDHLDKRMSEIDKYLRSLESDVRAALARPAVPVTAPRPYPPEVDEARAAYLTGDRERAREILMGAGYTRSDVEQWFSVWEGERMEEEWRMETRTAECPYCHTVFTMPYWLYVELQKRSIGHPSLMLAVHSCPECRRRYYSAHIAGAVNLGLYSWDLVHELGLTPDDLREYLKREWDRGKR